MFPISRSLSTSRRRTDELGSRLERPIHFECKLNEPMHIGMRLLHPAAADHSVSISLSLIRCSPPGPVGTRRPWPAVLMRPAEKLLQPCTLWRCCRFTRPRHWGTCTRVVTTQEFSVSFGPPRTSRYERRRLGRGLWAVRFPPWWSRNATSGCVWPTWRRQTRHGSWMPPCPRPASSATRWRTSPSSSPLHRSRLRQSGTSCPGVQLLPPPGRRRQCLGLLVPEGGPLPPPPLPRSRRSSLQLSSAVEPAAGQPHRPSRPRQTRRQA